MTSPEIVQLDPVTVHITDGVTLLIVPLVSGATANGVSRDRRSPRTTTTTNLTSLFKALKGAETEEESDRALLDLRDAGASYAQIAATLGVVNKTAQRRVHRARERLA